MSAYLLSIYADADTCKCYCIIEINIAVRIHVADIVAELRSNSDGCSHDGKCIADGERSVSVRIAAENDCDIIYAVIGVDIDPVAVIFIKENAIAEKTGSSMETHSRRGRMVLNSFFTIYSLKVIVHGSDWRMA